MQLQTQRSTSELFYCLEGQIKVKSKKKPHNDTCQTHSFTFLVVRMGVTNDVKRYGDKLTSCGLIRSLTPNHLSDPIVYGRPDLVRQSRSLKSSTVAQVQEV